MSTKDTKKKQEERASRLHQQIEDIKEGKLPVPGKVKNPREFIAEKMKELNNNNNPAENDHEDNLPDNE